MHRSKNIKIALVGGSAAVCLFALYLKEKNCDVTIFESSKSIGGAWETDDIGSKYSNIIYPLTIKEKRIYNKSIQFLKKFGVKFQKNFEKSLFSKKIVNA